MSHRSAAKAKRQREKFVSLGLAFAPLNSILLKQKITHFNEERKLEIIYLRMAAIKPAQKRRTRPRELDE